MNGSVLIITPSCGLGGGIERYAEFIEWALRSHNVEVRRIDLGRAGITGQMLLARKVRAHLERGDASRCVVLHRALLPAVALGVRGMRNGGITVVCHGSDVWQTQRPIRRTLEARLFRRQDVAVVAASSFTAGALMKEVRATVLSPGLSQSWFDMLVAASDAPRDECAPLKILTAFRLSQWRSKGLPEILLALETLGRQDVQLTVCGSGTPPEELRRYEAERGFVLKAGLADHDLAREFATADVFVLATRTGCGRAASGEGFGLVLLEAQIAKAAVIGPASGGSHDAYLEGITGLTPADQSAPALATKLGELLTDVGTLRQMQDHAGQWARLAFSPEKCAGRAIERLL